MLLLALLLAAPATSLERDDSPHLALVIGAGRAYGYMGAHLEVRWRTVDVGLGGGVARDFDRQDSFPRRLSRSTYPIPDFARGLGVEL